ncbi:MAG: S41 family peptidase [Bacteroidales bacterium]|jgi:hypothetical protein|nr:S41 family peptidase [Bacteroidales bacterium]
MKKLLLISVLFMPLVSSAQTPEQNKVVEEFVQRYNRGNDDIARLYYNVDMEDYNSFNKKAGEEIRELRSRLGKISDHRLIKKKGSTFFYDVTLGNAGTSEMKIAFKKNLIENFSFKTSEEFQIRSQTDDLIKKSFDELRRAYMALDPDRAFEEIQKIEELYNSGKSSKNDDFKYRIKFIRAELYAIDNNEEESLRLLSELNKEKPEYVRESVYNCSFASLHQNPEYVKLTYDPLMIYFALIKPVEDTLKRLISNKKPDGMLRCLDIKDSLYATLVPDLQNKALYKRVDDLLFRAAAYSMKGNFEEAIQILKEIKEQGWAYAVNYTVTNDLFKDLKQHKGYEELVGESNCNCREIFDWAVTEFEKSDAGFDYAVELKGKEAYEKHTTGKWAESNSITSSHDCVRLVTDWLGFFRKTHVGFFMNIPAFADTVDVYDKFSVRRLSSKTMYIKLKSFNGHKAHQVIARMIDANDYLISNTPNLIIDLRGNGGGSDNAWNPLCKYIESKPVYYTGGNMFRISEENAKLMERYGEKERADFIRSNSGKRFAGNSHLIVNKPNKTQKYPENILILTNSGTASAAESFLLYAKQSNKVKVMGQISHGAEEVGNCALIESPDKQFLLFYGTTIRHSAKLTQYLDYGIQPDIFLTSDIDWINAAKEYLEYR